MNTQEQEREMRNAFVAQARDALSNPFRFKKDPNRIRVGFEGEIAILGRHFTPENTEIIRDEILRDTKGVGDTELGAGQIEFRTDPFDCTNADGFRKLISAYVAAYRCVKDAVVDSGCSVLRIGADPMGKVRNAPRTSTPKYQNVPDYYNHHLSASANTSVGFGDRAVIVDSTAVSRFQAFQINLQAHSANDAVDKMNRSFMLGPYFLARAGNARYLECRDTRMCDVRLLVWEITFDTRTPGDVRLGKMPRVGLPENYIADLDHYLYRAGSFPFILYQPENALKIAIGMAWLDTRIKIEGDALVVEFRPIPTQPTVGEEILLTLLFLGRLHYAQSRIEGLLPFRYVRENRRAATFFAPPSTMWFVSDEARLEKMPYDLGMRREVDRAKAGLRDLGLLQLLDPGLLEEIIQLGPPSHRLAQALHYQDRVSLPKMMDALRETKMLID
jgi:hypothetical protein